jgi:hypothetical protein
MSVGEYIEDAIRNITGDIWDTSASRGFAFGGTPNNFANSAIYLRPQNNVGIYGSTTGSGFALTFSADRSVPTALENRPASISAYVCIKY